MICPSCGYTLQKLEVTTSGGGKFSVDHCGRCGGTWFDPYEINRIPFHEVIRLAHLTVLPKTQMPENDIHRCPHCHKNLIPSHYESMPKGVRMLRCPKCGGIWATQKSLEQFKKHQEEIIKEYKTSGIAFPSLSVVFVPAILTLLLFVSTFITVTRLQEAKEGRINAMSLIGNPVTIAVTSDSITIFFQTKKEVTSKIFYGTSVFEMNEITVNGKPGTAHNIRLTHLKPNTLYVYKVRIEDENGKSYTTSEYSFMTKL